MEPQAFATQLLKSACDALLSDINAFITKDKNGYPDQLNLTAIWLQNEIENNLIKSDKSFSQRAELLHRYTEMWSICWVASQQLGDTPQNAASDQSLIRSIQAAKNLVQGLYQITNDLDLELNHQMLIVVPFGSDLYSTGAELPTPFIVSPYWGHNQVWTWLGYAHEVGHHVYRNVKGVREELKVNLAMELWSRGKSYEDQRIWFFWLEEIFADLFALLRLGPAFARSQYLMLLNLPDPVAQPGVSNRLLVAADERHPIPYLRAYLALRALEKVSPAAAPSNAEASAVVGSGAPSEKDKWDSDLSELLEKWKSLLAVEPSKASAGAQTKLQPPELYALVKGQSVERSAEDLQATADVVLDVLLDTDLYALAKKSAPNEPPNERRNIRTVFSKPEKSRSEELLAGTQQDLEGLLQKRIVSPQDVESVNNKLIGALSSDGGGVSGRAAV